LDTTEKPLRVLVVEDEPDMALFISKLLQKKFNVEVATTPDLSTGRALIKSGDFDVVTLDYQLPDGDGIALLDEIARLDGHPPVIVVTGHGDEKTAVRAFEAGAAGYVVKDAKVATMLPDAFEKAVACIRMERLSNQLADSAGQLELVLDNVPVIVARIDADRRYIYANKWLAETFGLNKEDVVGMHVREVIGEEAYDRACPWIERVLAGRKESFAQEIPTPDGNVTFHFWIVPRLDEGGEVTDYFVFGALLGGRPQPATPAC